MKKTLLASLLKEASMNKKEVESFYERAELNPFSRKRRVVDLDDEDMDDIVRDRAGNRGLDKVSRSFSGYHAGVYGSRYDNMVRDIDDLDDAFRFDQFDYEDDDDDDKLYVSTNDKSYRRNEFNQDQDIYDIELDVGDAFMRSIEDADEDPFDEFSDEDEEDFSDEEFSDEEEDDEFDDLDPDMEDGDGRYEGVIRAVKGAYLVSKIQQPDETYTEIWIYNVGKKFEDEADIRKAILAATDIDPTKNFSEDGSQEAVIKTVGNVQFMTVVGLPD